MTDARIEPPFASHEELMQLAIGAARLAAEHGHRPFGCVIVKDGRVLATSMGSEAPNDPTLHSEIRAIREACWLLNGRLHGCTLVSTHELCPMCAGAANHAKLPRVAWGSDRADLPELFRAKEYGAREILLDTSSPAELFTGVLQNECIALFDEEMQLVRAAKAADGVR